MDNPFNPYQKDSDSAFMDNPFKQVQKASDAGLNFGSIYNISNNPKMTNLISDLRKANISRSDARSKLDKLCENERHDRIQTCRTQGRALIEALKNKPSTMDQAGTSTMDDAVGLIENSSLTGLPLALLLLFFAGDKISSRQRLVEEAKTIQIREDFDLDKQEARDERRRMRDDISEDRRDARAQRKLRMDHEANMQVNEVQADERRAKVDQENKLQSRENSRAWFTEIKKLAMGDNEKAVLGDGVKKVLSDMNIYNGPLDDWDL
jgi:hypothetical protein